MEEFENSFRKFLTLPLLPEGMVIQTQKSVPVSLHGLSMSFMTIPHQISLRSSYIPWDLPILRVELSSWPRILEPGWGTGPAVVSRKKHLNDPVSSFPVLHTFDVYRGSFWKWKTCGWVTR